MIIEIRSSNNEAIATLNRDDAIAVLNAAAERGADLSTLHLYDQDRERVSADELGVDFSVFEAEITDPEAVIDIIRDIL